MRLLILRDDPWLLSELPGALAGGTAMIAADFAPEFAVTKAAFHSKCKLMKIALRHLVRMAFSRFHRRVRTYDAVLACGLTVVLPYLLLARLGKRFRPQGRIVITFFFLHQFGLQRWVQRIMRWLLDDSQILLTVYSASDRDFFMFDIGLHKARVEVLPYGQPEAILAPPPLDRPARYVFAGGYSNRDYQGLGRALVATGLPAVVACSARNPVPVFPSGVRVLRDIDPREFNAWMSGADLVVIPLLEQVGSSGQAVALTAMALGRAILYSDIPCLREYFVPGITGEPYAHRNDEDLAGRLRALWDDPQRRNRMGSAARVDFESRFSQRYMFARLAELIRDDRDAVEPTVPGRGP